MNMIKEAILNLQKKVQQHYDGEMILCFRDKLLTVVVENYTEDPQGPLIAIFDNNSYIYQQVDGIVYILVVSSGTYTIMSMDSEDLRSMTTEYIRYEIFFKAVESEAMIMLKHVAEPDTDVVDQALEAFFNITNNL